MGATFNYATVMAEIERLTQQAQALRAAEMQTALASARELIQTFHFSASDLGLPSGQGVPAPRVIHRRCPATIKFKDPQTGAVWSGRGKTPNWLKAALAEGQGLDRFTIHR